ncbi:hypothetical protein P9112_006640 [Eukaryota sp. TZLM1-RC]
MSEYIDSDYLLVHSPPLRLVSRISTFERIVAIFIGILFFPVTLLASFFVVAPNENHLVLMFGKFYKVCSPGIHWISVFGRSIKVASLKVFSIRHDQITVTDSSGCMLQVSGVCTYRIVDPVKAILNIENVHHYLSNLSLAVLKKTTSNYPYHTDKPKHASLESDCSEVSTAMCQLLTERARACGVYCLSFEIVDIQYDASIAKGMMVSQTVGAVVKARKVLVEGASGIVGDTIGALRVKGLSFTNEERNKVISNLLKILTSHKSEEMSSDSRQIEPDFSEIIAKLDELKQEGEKFPKAFAAAQFSVSSR